MAFSEFSSIEHGFAPVFRERLQPRLEVMERTRLERVGMLQRTSMAIVAGCLAGIALLWLIVGNGDFATTIMVCLGVAAVFGPLAFWRVMSNRWALSVAETIMPVICDHLGTLSYSANADTGFPARKMEALGIVPKYETAEFTHGITGSYRNTEFELVQASLRQSSRSGHGGNQQSDVFEGLLLRVSVPKPVPGQILITRAGSKIARLGSNFAEATLHPVELGNADFEKDFVVLASEPVAARNYLSDTTLNNLLVIAKSVDPHFGPKHLTAGFDDRSFYLGLRRARKFLEMRDISQSLADGEELVHSAFAEITAIHSLIDQLHAVA